MILCPKGWRLPASRGPSKGPSLNTLQYDKMLWWSEGFHGIPRDTSLSEKLPVFFPLRQNDNNRKISPPGKCPTSDPSIGRFREGQLSGNAFNSVSLLPVSVGSNKQGNCFSVSFCHIQLIWNQTDVRLVRIYCNLIQSDFGLIQ